MEVDRKGHSFGFPRIGAHVVLAMLASRNPKELANGGL